jgi:transposase
LSASAAIELVRRVHETGSAAPARIGGYRKPLLADHEDLLRGLTSAKPGITLAEIQAELTGRGIRAGSLTTIRPHRSSTPPPSRATSSCRWT